MKLIKFSHFFVVTEIANNNERDAVRGHCIPLVHRDNFRKPNGELVYGEAKKFFSFNVAKTECRFHIHDLPNFLETCRVRSVPINTIEILDAPMYEPSKIEFGLNPYYQPRENQPVIIDFFDDPYPVIKLCEAEPGAGKTLTSLVSAQHCGVRIGLAIRPQYIDNWIGAIFGTEEKEPITDMSRDRVLVIIGSPELKKAIRRALHGDFDYDFIILSNATLFRMYRVYNEDGSTVDSYGCEPWELQQILGIGTWQKDEGHLDFHAFFLLDLFTHVPKGITLSGTFSSEHPFIRRMQLLQHPQDKRAPIAAPKKFRHVIAVRYSINPQRELRYKLRGRTEYNHNQFEESILKDPRARKAYLDLIVSLVMEHYLNKRESKEQKGLILCGRVEMAEVIIQRLHEEWQEMTVARYVSGDSIIEACFSEVIVTTIISGKAAIDVPNLIMALNTVNIGSKDSNLQALGRCRELRNTKVRPRFVYMYTDDISSASYYHQNKIEIFRSRVFQHDVVDSGVVL